MSQTPSPESPQSVPSPPPAPSLNAQSLNAPSLNAPASNAPTAAPARANHTTWLNRLAKFTVFAVPALVVLLLLVPWIIDRRAHSITDDGFVESHIVNIAPEMVSGRIVRFLVDENDSVQQGDIIAEIDAVPYQDRVNVAQARLAGATAELKRQEADLARLRIEVPIQIEIARRTLAAAEADHAKAEQSLKLTRDDVEKGIDEAQAGVSASQADFLLSEQEFDRFTSLYRQEAVPLRRSQEVTRSRDAAKAHVDLSQAKLAKALAAKTQVDIAERTRDAAQRSMEKAGKSVELALTGDDQIHVVELLVEVKRQSVAEARRGLETAEHDLEYTRLRAPFSGVVVKRYRHLGDFASAGVAVVSMYNPELLYVEANLEETRLRGVEPGSPVQIHVDAFASPFRGRVFWINKSTGAQFALLPRNVVSGEFTKVVQRVPVRISIDRDERWPQLRAGLSARVVITHGGGDPAWAAEHSLRLIDIEKRFNQAALVTASHDPAAQ
jgi:membrane fusion protein (multidrug efflux system)